jgi:hypothetical protein
MDRRETPADSRTNQGLTSLPADLADGHYRAVVLDVITAVTHRQTNRTVHVRIDSHESGRTLCTTLLPASAVGSSTAVRPGTVYDLIVEDGATAEAEFALDATIRRNATSISPVRYAVPLRWAKASAGQVAREPHVLPLERHHSLLVTGEPGAGKTEFVKLLLPQIESDPDEPVVVFNFKDDYTDWAREHAASDVVRLSVRNSTDHWNIFHEVTTEAEFEQLGKTLFEERERTAKNPFFPRTARQLFVAVLKYLSREGEKSGLAPDMREVRDFFGRFSSAEVFELLGEHEDLRGAVEAINPDAHKQAAGVYATLQSVVRELLIGDFCRPNGTFSIREYMADPEGRVLVLDYPIAEGDRVTPVFRLWIDRAIQHALADRARNAYFVLDEFARIPHIERLDTLVATGRARNTQAILGLQSLSQLGQTYDDDTVDALLSGLTQEVFLRSGDERTVEYVRARLATLDDVTVTDRGGGTETSVSGSPLSGRLQRFADGEGIVYATRGWVHVRVPMWRQLDRETQQVLTTRERARDGENQTMGGRGP